MQPTYTVDEVGNYVLLNKGDARKTLLHLVSQPTPDESPKPFKIQSNGGTVVLTVDAMPPPLT